MSEVVLAVVGGALALAGAVLCWRQRARGGRRSEAIRVVTSRYLGGKRFLTIVEVDGERLLLGLAGDQVRLVTRLPAPSAAEPTWPDATAAGATEAP